MAGTKRATEPRIGTAGWAVPRQHAEKFPQKGSGIERYAARLNAAEINSTFYRSHQEPTYRRWRDSVPDDFRFAVKVPKAITHEQRLAKAGKLLDVFLTETDALGEKRGPILVQLPPSLAFDGVVARRFFRRLRKSTDAATACEPRHASWFGEEADALLAEHRVARVAADPARVPEAAMPGGYDGLLYMRLHGSPRMYFSAYDAGRISGFASVMSTSAAAERWCIFDNTGGGAAAGDALALRAQVAIADR